MHRLIALVLLLAAASTAQPDDVTAKSWPHAGSKEIEVRMPPFETPEPEAYLCTSAPLPGGGAAPLRLTGVRPLSSASTVHHMLLFGEGGERERGEREARAFSMLEGRAGGRRRARVASFSFPQPSSLFSFLT